MTTQTIRFSLSELVRAASGLRASLWALAFPFPLYSDIPARPGYGTCGAPRAFGALRPALAQNPQNRPGARTLRHIAHSNRHAVR